MKLFKRNVIEVKETYEKSDSEDSPDSEPILDDLFNGLKGVLYD